MAGPPSMLILWCKQPWHRSTAWSSLGVDWAIPKPSTLPVHTLLLKNRAQLPRAHLPEVHSNEKHSDLHTNSSLRESRRQVVEAWLPPSHRSWLCACSRALCSVSQEAAENSVFHFRVCQLEQIHPLHLGASPHRQSPFLSYLAWRCPWVRNVPWF